MSYFYEWLKIDLKATKEYKLNIFLGFLLTSVNALIAIYILIIFNSQLGILMNWDIKEILFFVINIQTFNVLTGTFGMSRKLQRFILKGDLNIYLTKPISCFWQYLLATSKSRRLIVGMIYIFILLAYLIYYNISLKLCLIVFFFSLFAGFLFIVLLTFFDAFAFFMKRNYYLLDLVKAMNKFFRTYPFGFFDKFNYSNFLLIFPIIYTGSLATDFLFGFMSFQELLYYWVILIFVIFLFSFGTYLLWKIGLKKYEAYN